MLPVYIQAVHGVYKRFIAHGHFAGKRFFIQMHEGTSYLQVTVEIVCPVQPRHGLALHVHEGIALQLDIYVGAGINDVLVDDCDRTHAVVDRIVAVLGQGYASCGHYYRTARYVGGTQLYDIVRGARILTRQYEFVFVGNPFGNHSCRVIKLLKDIFVGNRIIPDGFSQVASERLHYRKYNLSGLCNNRIAFDEVKPAVWVGTLILIETVQIEHAQERPLFEFSLRQICYAVACAVAGIGDREFESGSAQGPVADGIDVLHHQVPCSAAGRIRIGFEQLDKQRFIGVGHIR